MALALSKENLPLRLLLNLCSFVPSSTRSYLYITNFCLSILVCNIMDVTRRLKFWPLKYKINSDLEDMGIWEPPARANRGLVGAKTGSLYYYELGPVLAPS